MSVYGLFPFQSPKCSSRFPRRMCVIHISVICRKSEPRYLIDASVSVSFPFGKRLQKFSWGLVTCRKIYMAFKII